ncbi:DUF2878 domain-containing protein [Pseudomonas lactis]|uniref:DUF2878 domain-containing protein n=1 Tax=Pseudomonas lactis TaxID=1615674 RepID=A0A219A059_9PSED|nr:MULTISPECIES: DUF2878 domain-containing protein [Pseudomonas]MBD8561085.1 DUF2878 domain-containing protein [Pseudomonas fluorescens]MBR7212083.1 DUF2878 domain-containing protein [Pseudomonas sp. B2021]MDI3248779.1 DUF2878 domain-containing protein [Pseudomonas sp. AL10]MDI3264667.1 DUF2878 domain-containing protein [Pseudomonas sp. AL15]MDR8373259.1 DUF2878 domain-containing protein [Pseudomonas lactis]
MLKPLANAVLFQCGWFVCVLGGDSRWLLIGIAALGVHLLWISSWTREGQVILAVTVLGTLVDTALRGLGVFEFNTPGPLIPLWLILLWALLATTLRHCLAWSAQPWWLASLLGAVGGPLSYYAGSQLAGVSFGYGTIPTLIGLALLWAMLFPLLHRIAQRLEH